MADITDFRVDEISGFTHENGRLKVPYNGYYYIYAQAWALEYSGDYRNRLAIAVNGYPVSIIQTSREGSGYGGMFSAVTKYLKRGDYISLKTVYPSKLWMANGHIFSGAYQI